MQLPYLVLVSALSFFSLGPSLTAQGQAPSTHSKPAPIVLNVQVSDGDNRPFAGLTQADFTVHDNGQISPLFGFRVVTPATPSPTEVIIVLDAVNLSFIGMSEARNQLGNYLRKAGEQLPAPTTILLLTDTNITSSGDPIGDGKTLADELDKAYIGLRSLTRSSGFYGAEDRLNISIGAFRQVVQTVGKVPGRKMLIWVSSGWPYLASPGASYSPDQQKQLFNLTVDLSTMIRNSGVTLYSVDPLGMYDAGGFQVNYYQGFTKGTRRARDVSAASVGLQVLAIQSGGLVLNSSNDVASLIAKCIADASNSYQLQIKPATSEAENEFHELSVTVDKPYLKTRTLTAYYAQP